MTLCLERRITRGIGKRERGREKGRETQKDMQETERG